MMAAVDNTKTTKILLIFYITIVTMHCMQNGISLQLPMVRIHVMVLVGQLYELLLAVICHWTNIVTKVFIQVCQF